MFNLISMQKIRFVSIDDLNKKTTENSVVLSVFKISFTKF